MLRLVAFLILILFPVSAAAPDMPRRRVFALYVQLVPKDVVARRMEQMFVSLPDGPVKNQARTLLKDDLDTAIGGHIDPLALIRTDVNDSTLATPTPEPTP
jgi:hypothetical protein